MHSRVRVMKQAVEQLRKASSWIEPALEDDDELAVQWEELKDELEQYFREQIDVGD